MNKNLEKALKAKEEYRRTQVAQSPEHKMARVTVLQQRYVEITSKAGAGLKTLTADKKKSS